MYQFKTLRPVLFLCGGNQSPRRELIAEYLRKHHPNKLLFYAEDVWNQIASGTALNALESERQLAQLADVVLVVVESPGTYAELGAFSLQDDLRKKLLPICDEEHRHAVSFLNAGPIRWVDAESRYGPSIFTDFTVILKSMPEIEDRLSRIPHRRSEDVADIGSSPRHLLFLLCDLVAMVGPTPAKHCLYYLERILGTPPSSDIDSLLSLGVSMKILKSVTVSGMSTLYFRPLEDGALRAFQSNQMFSVVKERAAFLSVMQGIDECQTALEAVRVA